MAEKPEGRARGEEWWSTEIIEMRPGLIRLRGYPIEDLIGRVSFPAMIWLMLRGDLPSEQEAALLGAALGAAVDHGPQAPSIAIARMAATCGVGINSTMASAINVLGDVHGGAGEGAVAFYGELGFPPPLTRGLFVRSRSVGILAHAWEQGQRAERNKGPLPREWLWAYEGPSERRLGNAE